MKKQFILRMGSNSEKNYIYKTATLFTGLLIKANYFESASGLLSGLFLRLNQLKKDNNYIIDPISYVFGLDPENDWSIKSWQKVKKNEAELKIRNDLYLSKDEEIPTTWMRPIDNPKKNQSDKIEVKILKRAFKKLANIYFKDIEELRKNIGKKKIAPDDFNNQKIDVFVNNVIQYQQGLLSRYFSADKYKQFSFPDPKLILSPYFHIDSIPQMEFMFKIWDSFARQYNSDKGSLVLLATKEYFVNYYSELLKYFENSKISNIFIWLDDFDEFSATEEEITAYVSFICTLKNCRKSIYNLYSGGFSNLLLPFGLTGIINGPGYGLDRQIEPIQGGLPSAQYYIPTLRTRDTVFNAYDLIVKNNLGMTKNEFHAEICNCPICKNGIVNDASDILKFYGEQSDPKKCLDGKIRSFPSKEALERTTFHFILSRLIDFKKCSELTTNQILDYLDDIIIKWKNSNSQLIKWKNVLVKFI